MSSIEDDQNHRKIDSMVSAYESQKRENTSEISLVTSECAGFNGIEGVGCETQQVPIRILLQAFGFVVLNVRATITHGEQSYALIIHDCCMSMHDLVRHRKNLMENSSLGKS